MTTIDIYIPRILGSVTKPEILSVFPRMDIGEVTKVDMKHKVNERKNEYYYAFITIKLYSTDRATNFKKNVCGYGMIRLLYDEEAAQYVYGSAVHWYEATEKVYEDVLQKVHSKFPDFDIIHTEGTIDDLGKPAPGGIIDTVKFQEENWFNNDSFWWNANATDWAYTATWAPNVEDHPIYVPVHRYARNIIVSFNHWMSGWIDWNIVLDSNGGPNHVGNFCGAPIMIDTANGDIYYTPLYYILSQLSQTIRPGDKAVQADKYLQGLEDDALHASATVNDEGMLTVQILNTTKEAIKTQLQVGSQLALVDVPANALQTLRLVIK